MPTLQTKETLSQVTQQSETLIEKLRGIYKEFVVEVDKHLKSGFTIPDISKRISDKKTTSTGAMKAINEATYYGQQLSNLYYSYYAPRVNELKSDINTLVFTLQNAFSNDPEVQAIKTSAEKERQFASFAFTPLQHEREAKKLSDSFYYLGKYTENVIFSLDRMQRMVDALDRLQGKEMWVDATAQEQAFSIINEASSDFDIDPEADVEQVNTILAKQDKETQLLDFVDEVSTPVDSMKREVDDDF